MNKIQPNLGLPEEFYKSILNTLSEGVALNEFVFDEKGVAIDYRILAVNRAYREIIGKEREAIAIGNLATKLYKLDTQSITAFWQLRKNAHDIHRIEFYNKPNERYYFVSTSPIFDNKFVTSFFEITNRVLSEQDLKEQQEVLKLAFESSGDGFWDWRVQEEKLILSPSIAAKYNLNETSLPSMREMTALMVHPEDREKVSTQMQSYIQKNIPFNCEHRSIMPDGELRWFLQRGAVLKRAEDGTPLRIVGMTTDITHMKATEAKMIHNSRMSSLGEMSAGIAHEVNNPLAIISVALDLIRRDCANPEKVKERMEMIAKATNRIEKIVSGLKKFSHSSFNNEAKEVLLSNVIDEAIALSDSFLKNEKIEIEVDVEKGLTFYCDEIEMEQVFVNLIKNSVDSIKNLKEKWIKIKGFNEADNFIVVVADSGPKIDKKIVEHLFEPFFTTKAVGEGTGLGLSIVKGILDHYQVGIQLDDECENVCFKLIFPKILENL